MREQLTQAIEDYIKAIYALTREGERATTNLLADRLGITAASVTGMLKTLASSHPPLVEYQKHRGVLLTPHGEKVALEVLRHHRLLEMFLHQVLGYDWDEVHAEADRLEHVISEEFEERMAVALGNPEHDPHGDPIPSRDLRMPDSPSQTLFGLKAGQRAVVHRVVSGDPEILRHLGELGIVPQASLEVVAFSPFDENLVLQVDSQPERIVLGPRLTRSIFVETREVE
jgi:DtxR family transcriptional regulator, Mn-dependent transcriptional regulator